MGFTPRSKWRCCPITAWDGVAAISLILLLPTIARAQLNDNCTVSVLNRSTQVRPDGTWVISNIPVNQGLVRARAVCTFSGITRFGQSELFTVPQNGSITLTPIVFGAVTPIPDSLLVTSPTLTLSAAGATTQLTVTAQYSNQPSVDVTSSQVGTTYTSSSPETATVSADGLVTAVGSGTALISAFNEGTVGAVSIQVGITPTILITSPIGGTTVTEGATVPVTTTTTGTVATVRFLVNNQVVFTSVTPPFTFPLVVPLNVSTVTLGAQADDGFGNIGTATPVQISVARDPRTVVVGTVTDAVANPVPGATVTCLSGSTTTLVDGTFSLPGEPTARGPIACLATATIAGVSESGISAGVAPVPSGTTNVGRIVVQAQGTLALVAVTGNNSATVVDVLRNTVLATVPAGALPVGAAVTSDDHIGVVSNASGSTLTFVDLTANPPVASGTLDLSSQIRTPVGLAVTPNGRFGIVVDASSTTVISVDLQQRQLISAVALSSTLFVLSSVAITPDGAFALVVSPAQPQVSVLAIGADGTLSDTGQSLVLSGAAGGGGTIAITPDGRRALVVDTVNSDVHVVGITGNVLSELTVLSNLGTSINGIAVTPDGTKAYVSDTIGGTGPDTTVAVLQIDATDTVTDTARRIVVTSLPLPVPGVPAIAVTPDGRRLWIAGFNPGQITIVDTATDTVLPQTIAIQVGPVGIGMPGRR
jgi:YVTN family beta-propeller protein